MNLPPLKIGELTAKVPIIQGGMGVGISLSSLASAVANEGGIGIISGVQIGYREKDFEENTLQANIRALKKEIRKARELSPKGILGVNILVAATHYAELVSTAVKEKIDLIICGAGLPSTLPKFIKGTKTKIAPIVSSGKAASVITKLWKKKFDYLPDLIVVEGSNAGGHLGFSNEDLESSNAKDLNTILKEVLEVTKSLEDKYNKHIPVVAAGGIFTGKDIAEVIKLGADGVQMATKFVATEECDAHINFKKAYTNSNKEDIIIIKSPVGMPGRAINNKFIKSLNEEDHKVRKCYSCIKHCDPSTTPYCISKALINAVNGDVDNGLIFAGTNAEKLDKITTVKELINELVTEAENNL
ncbi:nitronate monooxygenase family protein [Clostridium sp. MB40-C1]|uniref:NAD(P)H-dependent flavin oxidoreductase n=1 Tax=Clostridium sp. MB40-C1 TaxID=3070996 RepID=UPI0027E20495|nr:nitronate monooxygenase family protein [Clostridium sp. MB40-C1]WMJ82146.1 nitronate monooxygenase family protein [Clostridium sp. MB40-C1]